MNPESTFETQGSPQEPLWNSHEFKKNENLINLKKKIDFNWRSTFCKTKAITQAFFAFSYWSFPIFSVLIRGLNPGIIPKTSPNTKKKILQLFYHKLRIPSEIYSRVTPKIFPGNSLRNLKKFSPLISFVSYMYFFKYFSSNSSKIFLKQYFRQSCIDCLRNSSMNFFKKPAVISWEFPTKMFRRIHVKRHPWILSEMPLWIPVFKNNPPGMCSTNSPAFSSDSLSRNF